jgi:hypothetical protein
MSHGVAVNTAKKTTKFSLDPLDGLQEMDLKFHQMLFQVTLLLFVSFFRSINFPFLLAGESEDGESLFVGRVQHEGTVTVGKVQPSHGVCYISYAGQELGFNEFEVLVN